MCFLRVFRCEDCEVESFHECVCKPPVKLVDSEQRCSHQHEIFAVKVS